IDRLQGVGAVVLAGQHDHLGIRGESVDLLEELQTFGRVVGLRRQPEIHGDDRRLIAAQLGERALAVAGDHRLVLVERPLHLLLQGRVVLDDQERAAILGHAADSPTARPPPTTCPSAGSGVSFGAASGRRRNTRVPLPGALSTLMFPPSPATYCELSYTPIPMPVGLVVWKGLNSRSRKNSGVMPAPWSRTSRSARSASTPTRTLTFAGVGLASIAF